MGYDALIKDFPDIYRDYRNGLCHEYSIKGGSDTGVYVYYDPKSIIDFQKMGVDTIKGILLHKSSPKKLMLIKIYAEDFIRGIEKFLMESGKI